MPSRVARESQRANVRAKARTIDWDRKQCAVPKCEKLVRGNTSDGFDKTYCRNHSEHRRRHGSATAKSYPADFVTPYRRAALEYVLANLDDTIVGHTIMDVQRLYRNAGQHIEALSLRGLKPAARANAAFARLRQAGVDPRTVLAAGVAIALIRADGKQPVPDTDYAHVQIAKIVHRLASGTHKYWPSNRATPELHKFPMSRGRVLLIIGKAVADAVSPLVAERLPAILEFKASRAAAGKSDRVAKPRRIAGRKQTPKPPVDPMTLPFVGGPDRDRPAQRTSAPSPPGITVTTVPPMQAPMKQNYMTPPEPPRWMRQDPPMPSNARVVQGRVTIRSR